MNNLYPQLTSCRICPHDCGVNRYQQTGFCEAISDIQINLHQLHYGEEPALSGTRGSGTIFFSHCNLRCVFCQNHTISHLGWGEKVEAEKLMDIMLELQNKGAHNINLVTPTQYSIQLATILHKVKEQGLEIPIVWNSNAYEKAETLKLLEGLVDIYLPDLKYADAMMGQLYSKAIDYPSVARKAIIEMHRQTGYLQTDDKGIAGKGVLIRLLVMPNNVAGVTESLQWIHDCIGNETAISLMAQYYPTWQAVDHPEINRGINLKEYKEVLETLDRLGFTNGYTQELSCSDEWTPEFKRK